MAATHRMLADNIDTLTLLMSGMDERQTVLEQLQAENAQRQVEDAQRQAENAQRQARIEERQAETDQRFNILLEEIRFMNRRNFNDRDEQ
jgi:DNA-binding protein H-NS